MNNYKLQAGDEVWYWSLIGREDDISYANRSTYNWGLGHAFTPKFTTKQRCCKRKTITSKLLKVMYKNDT